MEDEEKDEENSSMVDTKYTKNHKQSSSVSYFCGGTREIVVAIQSLSHVKYFCNPVDFRLQGSSVHGTSQASILEWVAISYSRDIPELGIEPTYPTLAGGFFTIEPAGKPNRWTPTGYLK